VAANLSCAFVKSRDVDDELFDREMMAAKHLVEQHCCKFKAGKVPCLVPKDYAGHQHHFLLEGDFKMTRGWAHREVSTGLTSKKR